MWRAGTCLKGGHPVSSIGWVLGPACRLRALSRGQSDEPCEAGRVSGQLSGLAHPQPLPPAAFLVASCYHVRPVTTLGSSLSLDPLRCLGSGFRLALGPFLRPGHVFLLKWGLMPGAPALVQSWGPSDLGELLFRHRMVKDSLRASRLGTSTPLGPLVCGKAGRAWAVPVSAAASPGL